MTEASAIPQLAPVQADKRGKTEHCSCDVSAILARKGIPIKTFPNAGHDVIFYEKWRNIWSKYLCIPAIYIIHCKYKNGYVYSDTRLAIYIYVAY